MAGCIPNEITNLDHVMASILGYPQCKYLDCGVNIEFGYKYCNEHRRLCSVCKKENPI